MSPANPNSTTQPAVTLTSVQTFEVVDVERISLSNPGVAIRTMKLNGRPKTIECDVFIAGGGMGGIAAAIRSLENGLKVCMTEETEWLGGQMTSQGVSALDENHQVETCGATALYQKFRQSIRAHYRAMEGATAEAKADERLNPGTCWVSWLSFEPAVALAEIDRLLAEWLKSGRLKVYSRTKVIHGKVVRGRATRVVAVNFNTNLFIEFRPQFVIDATELGDLLPILNIPYVSGAESRQETGEPHAPEHSNPENVQDFTYPFVIEFRDGKNHTIEKPEGYEALRDRGQFSFLGYKMFDQAPIAGKSGSYLPFWTYRRLIDKQLFPNSEFKHDVSMINWESNDVRGENIIDKSADVQVTRLALGKTISLSFLYWMQTELPRDEGGKGYPELCLRFDVLGTDDGLSKYPYIRESRRIRAKKTIVEQEIAAATNSGARAALFDDSVGIGFYPIDIHGHQDVPGAGQSSKPFQIPLGSMVQSSVRNFLPACKNIGTTHVTNGAYRLHPIEWAIGEAAGEVAGLCRELNTTPLKILNNRRRLRIVQNRLASKGSPIFWYHDVPTWHSSFTAIQFCTVTGLLPHDPETMLFTPDDPVETNLKKRAEALLNQVATDEQGSTRAQFAEWCYKQSTQKTLFGKF